MTHKHPTRAESPEVFSYLTSGLLTSVQFKNKKESERKQHTVPRSHLQIFQCPVRTRSYCLRKRREISHGIHAAMKGIVEPGLMAVLFDTKTTL